MPLPNCASLPTIFRSVSTVTLLRSPASCTPSGDGGGSVAGPARLPAAGVDDGAARLAVSFDEVRLAAELAGDRSDLHLDLAEVVVAFLADQLRTGHQRDHLLEIGQHIPGRPRSGR